MLLGCEFLLWSMDSVLLIIADNTRLTNAWAITIFIFMSKHALFLIFLNLLSFSVHIVLYSSVNETLEMDRDKTSSSAMAERPRELDHRFQMERGSI